MDKLRITGLAISARIGVHDWEHQVRQQLLIDLELSIDAKPASATDALRDALDYGAVAREVRDIVSNSSCQLIEALAEMIAQRLLQLYPVESVRIVVHKPSAVAGASDTSIDIVRNSLE